MPFPICLTMTMVNLGGQATNLFLHASHQSHRSVFEVCDGLFLWVAAEADDCHHVRAGVDVVKRNR